MLVTDLDLSHTAQPPGYIAKPRVRVPASAGPNAVFIVYYAGGPSDRYAFLSKVPPPLLQLPLPWKLACLGQGLSVPEV